MKQRKKVLSTFVLIVAMSVVIAGTALAWDESISLSINSSAATYPNSVYKANDPGCNDYFAVYNYLSYRPTKAYSSNALNYGHMLANGGQQHGFLNYALVTGNPPYNVYLCVKHGWGANGWSVRIG